MILITYKSVNKEDAERQNNRMCESLKGWKAFEDNEVVVTPVREQNDEYTFNVFVGPDMPEQTSVPCIEIDDVDEAYIIS